MSPVVHVHQQEEVYLVQPAEALQVSKVFFTAVFWAKNAEIGLNRYTSRRYSFESNTYKFLPRNHEEICLRDHIDGDMIPTLRVIIDAEPLLSTLFKRNLVSLRVLRHFKREFQRSVLDFLAVHIELLGSLYTKKDREDLWAALENTSKFARVALDAAEEYSAKYSE